MLNIQLGMKLEKKLEQLAQTTGRSKTYYIREALRRFLEDREDYLEATALLERNEATISIGELKSRLGLRAR